jgi:hypothetical protein
VNESGPRLTLDEIDALQEGPCHAAANVAPIDRSPRPGREYDGDYYIRGREMGKSLYENYRWLPELTIPMARRIVEYCGIREGQTINDFGCARGYVVKALRLLGYEAYGQDVSEWAIANADSFAARYLCRSSVPQGADWTLAKDVLEHLSDIDLRYTLGVMGHVTRRGLFIVVPLAGDDGRYVVPEYEQDVTHQQRLTLLEWQDIIDSCIGPQWVTASTYHAAGIKENWSHYTRGNGFILARRTEA